MMARAVWPLNNDRPVIELYLTLLPSGQKIRRTLLADTGAGNAQASFQILVEENDCLMCGGIFQRMVSIAGAYSGPFPLYLMPVEIPLLGFNHDATVVGVPTPPAAFDGIACFRFLNRFTYGNFGNAGEFGLEM